MKECRMMVVLGAVALALAGVMQGFANPINVGGFEPRVISVTTNAVGNLTELEKAANKAAEALSELESLLAKEFKQSLDKIFIYRAGICYSFDGRGQWGFGDVKFSGFEYCKDDSYLLNGRIVSGRELKRELTELMRVDWKRRLRMANPLIAFCFKVGVEKVEDGPSRGRRRPPLDDDEEDSGLL